MLPTSPEPQSRKLINIASRFFWGAIIGCLLGLLPLSYVWDFASDVTTVHILVLVGFGLLGGILGTVSKTQQIASFFESISWF
ncbi:hypothetical protein [Allocoleopsis franciscana]|uniref:Uncharacterized protein n=1 Tax=Allocoleopsis franciscana PCC 7113 TaxID=1173027 RepID=K9WLI8_9CYAN|nr:hypothetical protein [Allocoleopsis franciscana]AFZ21270.1 hypothetical protein Mic7113_5642 [Allocoleopsis franciscana PCC 7113]